MVQVLGQLRELGASTFFLSDLLLALAFLVVGVEQLANLFVLVLHVLQILLSCEEVMLILSAVIASVAAKRVNKSKATYYF